MACTRLFRPCFFLGNNRLTVEKTFAGLEVFDNDALLSRQGKNSNKDLMSSYIERAEKIFSRVNEIAAITEEQGIMKHTYGCDAFIEAGKRVQLWMRLAGLETRIDNIGNFRGRWLCRTPNARTFIIASYVDSGINDRKFDGLSGVLTGLDVIENIVQNKTDLPFNIALIAFSGENGVPFPITYDLLGYLEMQGDPGPALHESSIPVAAVTAIAGQKRIELIFTEVAANAVLCRYICSRALYTPLLNVSPPLKILLSTLQLLS